MCQATPAVVAFMTRDNRMSGDAVADWAARLLKN